MTVLTEIHLSEGFTKTPSTEEISSCELRIKSAVALTLGIFPFAISYLTLKIFKNMAYLATLADNKALTALCGIIAVPTGAIMLFSAKIFGLTQTLAWGKYAKNPTGDGSNTRLAWYGVRPLAGKDFCSLTKVFFVPSKLERDERSLEEWSRLQI